MGNAAIYLNPEAYNTGGNTLMGRHSAGESFLRGYIRHSSAERFTFWNVAGVPVEKMNAFIAKIEKTDKPIIWLHRSDRNGLRSPGVAYIPTPNLPRQAWWRQSFGPATYGLCGITHTTASHDIADMIGDMMVAPVERWDALICTSAAVRAATESQIAATGDYLKHRLGATKLNQPLLEMIPLGINTEEFKPRAEDRAKWRRELDIPDDAVVALYVGRFNVQAKMNPVPMALAMELAAKQTGRPLYWIMSGWAHDEKYAERFHADTQAACPSIHYRIVDGRRPNVRFSIWSAADIFLSLSDNIQETFGLTPLEAMAAGLPCVVSDWDGYRESVRDGLDGFRIPTRAPRPGTGRDFAYRYSQGWDNYSIYAGASSQFVAVDIELAAEAIARLATDSDLRRTMGEAARQYAHSHLDWRVLIPRYEALWAEQNSRRMTAIAQGAVPTVPENPWRADPFKTFAGYASQHLHPTTLTSLTPGMTRAVLQARLSNPAVNYTRSFLPTAEEIDVLYALLENGEEMEAAAVVSGFPANRKALLERSLLWLAKHGVVRLRTNL
jgi:glycosyltransferase involved in cell wall biosynthesis